MILPVILEHPIPDTPVELIYPASPFLPVRMSLTTMVHPDSVAVILDFEDQHGYLQDCESTLAAILDLPELPIEPDLVPTSALGQKDERRG